MANKLFKVSYWVEFYLVAEDESDAYVEADSAAESALRDGGGECGASVYEVTDVNKVPKQWLSTEPYGYDCDGRTIKQILTPDPEEAPPPKDTWTLDLFPKS